MSTGDWNASHYKNPEFDSVAKTYLAAAELSAQRKATKRMAGLLLRDTPVDHRLLHQLRDGEHLEGQELRPRGPLAHPAGEGQPGLGTTHRAGRRCASGRPPALGSTSVARFLVKRIGLALITLVLLSMIVFAVSSILPGNVGRAVLGPFATQESVDALNEQLGTNRSLVSQYIDWVSGLLHGDLGTSLTKQVPAWDVLWPALQNSFKLAFVAFIILRADLDPRRRDRRAPVRAADRQGDHDVGLSVSAMPDFVTGIVLILVFAIWLGWLPVTAQAEPGRACSTQVEVPAPACVHADARALRLHRPDHAGRDDRGVRQRLRADRVPQGAPTVVVVGRKHVLRNALLPTIAVDRRPVSGTSSAASSPSSTCSTTRALGSLDARGGAPEGPAAADRRRARDRDRLPRRDADRRHPLRLPQPANPVRGDTA